MSRASAKNSELRSEVNKPRLMNRKYIIFKWLYFILVALVLIQAAVFGFDAYIMLPILCLIVCYYKMKQHERK